MEQAKEQTGKGYGFYKVAAASFPVRPGDVHTNVENMKCHMQEAAGQGVRLLVFPELSVTGYTCGDLFLHREFLREAERALYELLLESAKSDMITCAGLPVESCGKLFNCAVYLQGGHIIGVVPKTYLPNYGEFYEKRWFTSAEYRTADTVTLLWQEVPFSERLLLAGDNDIVIGTEICEDLWVDSPPSGPLSRAGATIIVNPSASNDLVGKREYRRDLVRMQSGRCRCGYVYASSGSGESSTDLVFSGHCMIADNGKIVAESKDIMEDDILVIGLIDIERCMNDRVRYNSTAWGETLKCVEAKILVPRVLPELPEYVDPYPFVPNGANERKARCNEILSLQAKGLMQRLRATGFRDVVLGISGGLDSTLALLVCCIAFDRLGIPRENIHTITMPGFGTTARTKTLADSLMECLGTNRKCVDITAACRQHMKDIGHAEDTYDVTYENIQARERTQVLFDYANMVNGLVIGTGDMSELALGWCTYNGDHMSNYAVNTGVPKTLVRYLVDAYAESYASGDVLKDTLKKIVDLPISPELLPADENGNMVQKTEESIGKYDLHDFFLYHYLRNGSGRDRILALAGIAFPDILHEEIEQTLDTFFVRFRTQQFKRSCIPDGVKIGSVALSPRGDLRLPSDLAKLY